MGRIALTAWIGTVALAAVVAAPTFAKLIEGYDRSRLLGHGELVVGVAFLTSLGLTVSWATRLRRRDRATPASGRRRFLLGALGAAGGLAATLAAVIAPNRRWFSVSVRNIFAVRPPYKADAYDQAWSGARVSDYRRLGRTEFRVSEISLDRGKDSP